MATLQIPTTYKLVDDFHQEVAAESSPRKRTQIIKHYVSILRLRSAELSADAEAIEVVVARHMRSGTVLDVLRALKDTARDSTPEARKDRAMKVLVACWSWHRVHYYQWDQQSYKILEGFVSAAKKLPAWEDFVAAANLRLLKRQEKSVTNQKVPRVGEHSGLSNLKAPFSPLERRDVMSIAGLCADSAEDSDSEQPIRDWINPCRCLLNLFAGDAERAANFILRYDDHHMIVPHGDPATVQYRICDICKVRPQTSVLRLPGSSANECGAGNSAWSGRNDSPSSHAGTSQYDSDNGGNESSGPEMYATDADDDGPMETDQVSTHRSLLPSERDDNPMEIDQVSSHKSPLPSKSDDSSSDQSSSDQSSSRQTSPNRAEETEDQNDLTSVSSSATGASKYSSGAAASEMNFVPSPFETAASEGMSGSIGHLSILVEPVQDEDDLYIEQALHKKYHISLRNYYNRTQAEAENGSLYKIRSEWFTTDIEHAKVWCPAECKLGVGSAVSEQDADVWHYSMDVFIEHAMQHKSFTRPVLIKDNGLGPDRDFHSNEIFMTHLQSAYEGKHLDVQSLEQTIAKSIPMASFQTVFRQGTGLNALNLRNLTKSYRPLFTLLPRFRLLDILVERAEVDTRKKVMSTPVDVSSCSAGFNIYAAANAFSGAHQDFLGHTWVRNLDGLKFWMTVHPEEMQSSWQEFHQQGSHWVPNGKAKLTIIEKGDILVMMPDEFDRATVHGVHSPEESLMEGAMFFDNTRILSALNCLADIGQHQDCTNEAIAYQLPHVIRELESLLQTNQDLVEDASRPDIVDALRRLEELGCKCFDSSTEQHECACQNQNRRCTAWCSGHPDLPDLICMEDGRGSHPGSRICCTRV